MSRSSTAYGQFPPLLTKTKPAGAVTITTPPGPGTLLPGVNVTFTKFGEDAPAAVLKADTTLAVKVHKEKLSNCADASCVLSRLHVFASGVCTGLAWTRMVKRYFLSRLSPAPI
jgi:hypothetical protein